MGRYTRAALLLFQVLCIPVAAAYAQGPSLVSFTALTTENGLSHGMVISMLQDRKGFMWFGTDDGLNRYDGYEFKVFRHSAAKPASLAGNDVYCLFEDSRGLLWIGTGNGLDVLDQATWRFVHVPCGPDPSSETKINQVLEDRNGDIWISTGRGLVRLTVRQAGNGLRLERITAADTLTQFPSSPAGPIRLIQDSRGTLLGVNSESVFRLTPGDEETPTTVTRLYTYRRGPEYYSGALLEDTAHHSYLLQTPDSLLLFPDNAFAGKPIPVPIGNWYPPAAGPGDLFFFIHGRTIATWKPGMAQPARIGPANPTQRAAFESARCLYWDRNGNLWIGTNGFGILKQGKKPPFSHVLDGQYITSVFTGPGNDVYISERYHLRFPEDGASILDSVPTIERGVLDEDPRYIWMAEEHVLKRKDRQGHVYAQYPLPGCTDNYVLRTLGRGPGPAIWMQHADSLIRFDMRSCTFNRYRIGFSFPKDNSIFIRCFLEDGNCIWLGTEAGLFRFDTARLAWQRFPQQPGDSAMQHNFMVLNLTADPVQPARYLWACTKNGLWRLEKQTGRWKVFNEESGLPDHVINAARPDRQGHLWISTNRGLTRMDVRSGAMQHYDRSNGLINYEYNMDQGLVSTGGVMVFGGLDGLDYFRPEDVHPLPPPQVSLTGLRLFNKPVSPGDAASPLREDIGHAKDLWLNHQQDMLTLVFAGLDYSEDNAILYRYRLEGFDADWVYAGKGHEAIYTNLDPGDYRFYAQASYSGGEWSNQPALLRLHITPPWWRRWWFYAAVLLAVSAILYGLYRYRLRQLMKVERMRKAIARDLHDDIGATLSTITIYSNVARQQLRQEGKDPEPLLLKITDNSQKVLEAISDIIWSVNAAPTDFGSMLSRMREHAADLLSAQNCELHIAFPEQAAQVKLPIEKWKDFYLVYKEALNNIAKYATAQNVWISLRKTPYGMELCIRDDGRGFDPAQARRGGNGLANMKARAAAIHAALSIESAPGAGTAVVMLV